MDTISDPKTAHHLVGALSSSRLIEERRQQEPREVICLCLIPVVLGAYSRDDSDFDHKYNGSR